MPTPLEAATVDLDRQAVAALGDTFTYTPQGGSPAPVIGFVDYDEEISAHGASAAVAQQIMIEAPVAAIAVRPDESCRVTGLSRFPGEVYRPSGVVAIDSGWWRFALKKVSA